MTALAALLRHDGGDCGDHELRRMLEAARHHGAHHTLHVHGPGGLGQADPAAAPTGAGERDASTLRIVFSGRLHNRDDLVRLARRDRAPTDADLVRAAYGTWGDACASRLLGEFAFVILDTRRRRLVAARDAMGTRTLFYARAGAAWLVASECDQLLAHPHHVATPDEAALRRLLDLDIADVGATFWSGVRRLPPAHTLVVDELGPRLVRYWAPDPAAEIRYPDGADYVEHFRSVFAEAVRCRLSGPEPVGCLFSGGVDSSAVLCMAHEVRGGGPTPAIEAFAMLSPAAPVDDRPFVEAVRTMHGASVRHVAPPALAPVRALGAALRRTQGPFVHARHHVLDSLFSACAAQGCRVVLSGLRGDDIFGGPAYLGDRARRLEVRGLRAELEAWSPVVGVPAARLGWELCVRPWLRWADPVRRALPRPGLARGRRPAARRRRLDSLARDEAHELALGPFTVLTTELFELDAAGHGLVASYPLWDRRLVELVLALPQEMRAVAGVTKRVLREAMAGLMPEPNRLRTDKLSLAPFFRRGLVVEDRERVVDALSRLHPTLAPMVRRERVPAVLGDLLGNRDVPMLQVWFLVCANLWLRQVAGETPAAP